MVFILISVRRGEYWELAVVLTFLLAVILPTTSAEIKRLQILTDPTPGLRLGELISPILNLTEKSWIDAEIVMSGFKWDEELALVNVAFVKFTSDPYNRKLDISFQ